MLERCTTLQLTMPMKNIVILHTTVSKIEEARKLTKILLDKKLIGCAQIEGAIESMYRWNNAIESGKEYRLSVKTTSDLTTKVMDTIKKHHPYELPEIVGNNYEFCSEEYRNWLIGEVNNESA